MKTTLFVLLLACLLCGAVSCFAENAEPAMELPNPRRFICRRTIRKRSITTCLCSVTASAAPKGNGGS